MLVHMTKRTGERTSSTLVRGCTLVLVPFVLSSCFQSSRSLVSDGYLDGGNGRYIQCFEPKAKEVIVPLSKFNIDGSFLIYQNDTLTSVSAKGEKLVAKSSKDWQLTKMLGPNKKGMVVIVESGLRNQEHCLRYRFMNLNTGKQSVIYTKQFNGFPGPYEGAYDLHPTEPKLAFLAYKGIKGEKDLPYADLCEVDLLTNKQKILSSDASDDQFRYELSGRRIYFFKRMPHAEISRKSAWRRDALNQRVNELSAVHELDLASGNVRMLGYGENVHLTQDGKYLIVYDEFNDKYMNVNQYTVLWDLQQNREAPLPKVRFHEHLAPLVALTSTVVFGDSLPTRREDAGFFNFTDNDADKVPKRRLVVHNISNSEVALLNKDFYHERDFAGIWFGGTYQLKKPFPTPN